MTSLDDLLRAIGVPDRASEEEARRRLDAKTKPPGSLGRLEDVAVQLAGIYGTADLVVEPRAVVVAAADHGVTAQGVNAFPREVTAQMVRNFASGGAAVNVLARLSRASTRIVDFGVDTDAEWPPEVLRRPLGRGTADMTGGPAMSREQAAQGIGTGAGIAAELADEGARVLVTGEMGIGNTTAAAALASVFTGRDPAEVTGPGTGLAPERVARKVEVVRRALASNRPDPGDPLGALAAVGGFEIAGLAGVILGAAAKRRPVVLDGFIAGAAALVAAALRPEVVAFLIAGHRSAEPGHRAVLERLGLAPLLELDMRLGEGTGALLALPVLDAAAAIVREMATFESAGVAGAF